jgi:hypothetical protein
MRTTLRGSAPSASRRPISARRVEEMDGAVSKAEADRAAARGKQQAFGKKETSDARGTGAERAPDRKVSLLRLGAHQEQVCDVGACR